MSERALRFATCTLALAGAGVTTYLLVARLTGATIACTTGGCEAVQHSASAEVARVPVAALGLAGYAALFAAAAVRGDAARVVQGTFALTAFLFSTYLLVVQVVVIGALCQWCVAADVVTTAIAALSLLRFRSLSSGATPRAAVPR